MTRGAERRYLVAIGRLCEVFADKVSRDKRAPSSDLQRRLQLSVRWESAKRQLQPPPAKPNPTPRRVGNLRVIDGGRARR